MVCAYSQAAWPLKPTSKLNFTFIFVNFFILLMLWATHSNLVFGNALVKTSQILQAFKRKFKWVVSLTLVTLSSPCKLFDVDASGIVRQIFVCHLISRLDIFTFKRRKRDIFQFPYIHVINVKMLTTTPTTSTTKNGHGD